MSPTGSVVLLYFGHLSSASTLFMTTPPYMSLHWLGSFTRTVQQARSISLLTAAGVEPVTFHSRDVLLTTSWPRPLHNKKIFGEK